MFDLKKLIAAVSFVTLGLSASAVMAQNDAPAQPQAAAAQEQPLGHVSDTDLEKFINANVEVSKVREEYAVKFNHAKDQEKAQELQQEAQDEMLSAVEESGLDASSYNMLAEQIQSNTELQERIQKLQ